MGDLRFNTSSPRAFIDDVLDLTYFGEGGVFQHTFVPSKTDSKTLVITGQNASGKSFVRRLFTGALAHVKYEAMALSQEKRTGADFSYGPARVMIFGDEATNATGVLSARTVTTGISTCRNRTEPHGIIWDEPDLGLSDEYAMDLGHRIAEFSKEQTKTFLIVVISHRRELLEPIGQSDPHYLHIGPENPKDLSAWLNRKVERKDVEALYKESHERFLAIRKYLKD